MSESTVDVPRPKKMKYDHIQTSNKTQLEKQPEPIAGCSKDASYEVNERDNKYDDFVTAEDIQKLREFKVLDEVNDEGDSNESHSSDEKSEGEALPEEEIEKMLDEDMPHNFKEPPIPKDKPYITKQKLVLEEKGVNHFEVLPLDWMMVRHCSGMPVYVHRGTRVCTLSKPYFIGKGNIRRHDIPISAIPCLAYRTALKEEEKQLEIDREIEEQIRDMNTLVSNLEKQAESDETTENDKGVNNTEINDKAIEVTEKIISQEKSPTHDKAADGQCPFISGDTNEKASEGKKEAVPLNRQPVVLPGGIVMPPPRVETINTSWKTQHLTHEQVNDYCKSLFKFKSVNIMHFKRWADRRKYTKARKALQYPTLPEGTKLITIPGKPGSGQDGGSKSTKRDWVMNMNGCSYLSVFHEYVRRALQKQPVYEYRQLENATSPYQATVYIGGMQYGVGHGSSKRQAKSAAARASIQILIPEMREDLDTHTPKPEVKPNEPDFTFFDCVGIEDPRISEFCAATSEPSPHAILRTCLLRNFGAGERHIQTEMKKLEYQKIELKMTVGKHSATVVCKNKKTAKQRASQAILQALHPHVQSWGSLLRLYGSRSIKSCKEKKQEEQQITLLQDKARHNEPNYAVLEKLRDEMKKLHERDQAVVPIGTLLLLTDDLPSHSGSNLNNVDL